MKQAGIFMKRIGYSNVILIVNGSDSIIVDTGVKGNLKKVLGMLKQCRLKPDDVKLIILTHTHYDHTGNLQMLQELTRADVMVHELEYENLKKGYMPIPDGQRFLMRIVSGIGKVLVPRFASPKPFSASIINKGNYDLTPWGIKGKVIHTPGHSHGSQSVIIGEEVISGDCFMNMNYGVVFPHFAENPRRLLEAWKLLFDLGVRDIYPGHGKKLSRDKAWSVFLKWKKRLEVNI